MTDRSGQAWRNSEYPTAVCGGTLEGRSGELHSPNYPLTYAGGRECVFIISTPPATTILLHFEDFELEQLGGYDCFFDYVEVQNQV